MRKNSDTCKACEYADEKSALEGGNYSCRESSPQVVAVLTPQGVAQLTVFPTVSADNWCGKFSPIVKLAS